jgi:predicted nuclease of restriction endonuclease-like RecB superfamily
VRFKYEPTRIAYVIAGHYIPDFVIDTPTGKVFLETKGYFRPEAKRKMVAVKKQHPELDIRIIFYSNKLKDIRWADKHGFKWAIDKIPQEWLDGL